MEGRAEPKGDAGTAGVHPADECRTDIPKNLAEYGIVSPYDAAHPSPDAGSINGRLPPETIQKVVRAHYGVFRQCYEEGLRRDGSLSGKIITRFIVERDGTVQRAKVDCTTLHDEAAVRCIVSAYRDLVFPSPGNGVVTVVYPIMFPPGDAPQPSTVPSGRGVPDAGQ